MLKIKYLKIILGQVSVILESKASALGTNLTVPWQQLWTPKKRLKLKLWTPKKRLKLKLWTPKKRLKLKLWTPKFQLLIRINYNIGIEQNQNLINRFNFLAKLAFS